ncbi:hypothetical protein EDC96DRAFT_611231 [Choanephora cucurbitarum]|nr:hypothetical protein EDC96DRAFT_611231 [Choanephora cucurbitarum]
MSNKQESLEERLVRLAATDTNELPEFPDDKSDLPDDFEYHPEEYEDQEEEIVEELSENELLRFLDQQEDPLTAVQRLFYHELNSTASQSQSEAWHLTCLTPKALEELYGTGWTEIEGLIDLDTLKGASQEAQQLAHWIPSTTNSGSIRRDDEIVWFNTENEPNENEGIVKAPPHLKSIVDYVHTHLYKDLAKMIKLNGQNEYQLSHFAPGGCYGRHRDAFPTDDPDQRRITVLIYLSSEWTPQDGGELKVCSPVDQSGLPKGADRVLSPTLGRIFIALSGAVDYEILATQKDRYAFHAWFR